MKPTTIARLVEAWNYCDENDKSTEFMIQYMQDVANVDFDTVINFITTYERKEGKFKPFKKKGVKNAINK